MKPAFPNRLRLGMSIPGLHERSSSYLGFVLIIEFIRGPGKCVRPDQPHSV